MKAFSRSPRFHLLIYISYLVVALVITWPLITVFSTRLIGHPFGDSYEYIGLIWWFKRALQTSASPFFQPLLAYPDGLSALFVWSVPLQSFPAWLFAFVMPLPAAFNLSLLLNLALNGWSAFFLVAHLTGNRAAAWVSGLVFMAYPTFQGHIVAGHVGLLVQWGVPLYVYALLRLRHDQERRWIILGALCFLISLLGSSLILIYALLPITVIFLLTMLFRREWAALRRMLLAVVCGGLVALIFIVPSALDALSVPARLRERADTAFSADLLAVVSPSFQHPLFGRLDYPHRVLGIDPFERMAYIGITAGLLALIAVWRKSETRGWLLLGVVVWICSLGPILKILDAPVRLSVEKYETFMTLPWLAGQYVPLLDISRTPARFNFTLALVVAVLVGYGLSVVWDVVANRRPQSRYRMILRWLIITVVAGFTLYEYFFFWSNNVPDMPTLPGIVPEPIVALAGNSDVRAVFDVPWEHLLTDKEAVFLQTGHQQPLIAGHITRRTPVDPAKLTLLQETLSSALLNDAGADIIILHKQWDDEEGETETFTRAKLGEPFYEDDNYAAFNTPESDALPVFTAILSSEMVIRDYADSYLYTPSPGWVVLMQTLTSDGRDVTLSLNDTRLHDWHIDGELYTQVPVFLPQEGYYTLNVALDPPCPVTVNPVLTCRSVTVSDLALSELLPADVEAPVEFAGGLTLIGFRAAYDQNMLSVWLSWRFDAARSENDIRFIHVLDAEGNLVAQVDETLGVQQAGSEWSEAVSLTLPPDLPLGEYYVYTGWYTYPDTTPYPILSDVPDAETGRLEIGTFSVE